MKRARANEPCDKQSCSFIRLIRLAYSLAGRLLRNLLFLIFRIVAPLSPCLAFRFPNILFSIKSTSFFDPFVRRCRRHRRFFIIVRVEIGGPDERQLCSCVRLPLKELVLFSQFCCSSVTLQRCRSALQQCYSGPSPSSSSTVATATAASRIAVADATRGRGAVSSGGKIRRGKIITTRTCSHLCLRDETKSGLPNNDVKRAQAEATEDEKANDKDEVENEAAAAGKGETNEEDRQ